MAYMHINNLYKDQAILMFKECYCLEKIHGTSAHISYDAAAGLRFFSGGASHILFIDFFNHEDLLGRFRALGFDKVTVYGEAYGGKLQGMRETYGDKLFFTAFEVKIGGNWLRVPSANDVADKLGLEFVPYNKVNCTIENLNEERNRPSVISERRTGETDKEREGIVLRPLIELTLNNGARIIAKHKNDNFSERASKRDTNPDPEIQKILEKANDIAFEWVTPTRLSHIIDKLGGVEGMEDTPRVMAAMVEDILREAKGEIVNSKEARKAISSLSAKMLKEHFKKKLMSISTKEGIGEKKLL